MLFRVLDRFTVKTPQGEKEINPGQIVKLDEGKAQALLKKGKIEPCEESAHGTALPKYTIIYSLFIDDYLLATESDRDAQALRASGILDAVYSHREVKELEKLPSVSIKAHHLIKKIFPGSAIVKG